MSFSMVRAMLVQRGRLVPWEELAGVTGQASAAERPADGELLSCPHAARSARRRSTRRCAIISEMVRPVALGDVSARDIDGRGSLGMVVGGWWFEDGRWLKVVKGLQMDEREELQ